MLLKLAEYHRPQSLAHALDLLQRPGAYTVPLAGGTELLGTVDSSITAVVDLAALGLDRLEPEDGGLRIGAMATLAALSEHPAACRFAGGLLARAAAAGAPRTIRNASTLGGSLAGQKGGPELQAALIALGARVLVTGAPPRHPGTPPSASGETGAPATRDLPVEEFLARRAGLLPGRLITGVYLPALPPGARTGFSRVARTPADRAIACAAAVVGREGGRCTLVRIGAAGLAPLPGRLPAVEAALHGRPLDAPALAAAAVAAAGAAADAPADLLASGEYRRWVAPVLVRRALAEAGEVEP